MHTASGWRLLRLPRAAIASYAEEKMIGYLADQIENRTVVLRNLPENVTDEQLKELFPDAPNFLLARDKDHKPKG